MAQSLPEDAWGKITDDGREEAAFIYYHIISPQAGQRKSASSFGGDAVQAIAGGVRGSRPQRIIKHLLRVAAKVVRHARGLKAWFTKQVVHIEWIDFAASRLEEAHLGK